MSGLGNFLAGMASGYGTVMKFRRDAEDAKDREEERKFRREERERQRKINQQDDEYRQGLMDASAPVAPVRTEEVRPESMDNRDVGQAGEPSFSAYAVRGAKFADTASAEKAAADMNTPAAQAARVGAYMRGKGRFGDAAALENQTRQAKLADLQMEDIEVNRAIKLYDRQLADAAMNGGHEGIAKFGVESPGDGAGGKRKMRVVPGADGKTVQYALIEPDGKERILPYTFTNDDKGVQQAAFTLSRGVPTAEKLKHVMERNDKERGFKIQEEELARRKTESDRDYQLRLSQFNFSRQRAAAEDGKVKGLPQFDEKAAADLASDLLKKEADRRAAEGQPPMTAREEAAFRQQRINAFKAEYLRDMQITGVRRTLGALRNNPAEYAAAYTEMVQDGGPQVLEMLKGMGFNPPPGLEKQAPTPAAAAARGVPQVRGAQPAQAQPGMDERLARRLAATPGHARQAEAAQFLKKLDEQRRAQPEPDQAIGYGA